MKGRSSPEKGVLIMLVRIMARNKAEKYAYAEVIKSYTVMSAKNNRIMYRDENDVSYFGDLRDIVRNPEIIKVLVEGYFYKIKLPEGL